MYKYLSELKNRFVLLIITWISNMLVSYFYKETLLFLLIEPDILNSFTSPLYYFIFTDILEIFSTYIQLILFLSLQIIVLYFFYHFFVFLNPSLFFFEHFYLCFIFKIIFFIWVLSIILAKYILIPLTWNFFFSFKSLNTIKLHFEAKLNEYLNFYISFYYLCILYCQIFTILIFFFFFTKINSLIIKKFRKIHYYFLILLTTLLSPPEILSQIIVSLILIFFYELFIFSFIFKLNINFLIRQPIKTNKNSNSKQ